MLLKAAALIDRIFEPQGVLVHIWTGIISAFVTADIIQPPDDMHEVQTELNQRGFYNARIDGSFGPATRLAIKNYRGRTPNIDLTDELAGLLTL